MCVAFKDIKKAYDRQGLFGVLRVYSKGGYLCGHEWETELEL